MSKSFWKIILLLVISSLLYKLFDVQEHFKFTVREWESIVTAILKFNLVSNLLVYDLNSDGSIDVRDLCAFYSGFSGKDNKKFPKRSFNTFEATIFRHQDFNCMVSRLISEVRGVEEEHFNKHFPDGAWGEYKLGNYIKECALAKCIKHIPPLRC